MSLRRVTFLLSFALAACAPLTAQPSGCPSGSPSVSPAAGPICGKPSSITIPAGAFTANAYLGIPYAQPPVGKLRWQNPVAHNSWTAPFSATQFGNKCPQAAAITNHVCSFKTSDQSEDCLYLNVWTPTGATPSLKLPVLVFIHGGGFLLGTGGTKNSDLYDGTYLAASQNVVVVTFNYRLGALGFLATDDMPSGAGNFGFSDQLMALNWVHQNIASFGGDPSQALLFGESAGAMSVGLHALSSPQSAGLFKAALMESNPLGIPYKTLEQARKLGKDYSILLNCSDLQCLRQKSACELVVQENSPCLIPTIPPLSRTARLSSVFHWAPVFDGSPLSGQPMANTDNLKMPMLLGTNRDEGVLFASLLSQPKSEAPVACPFGLGALPLDVTKPTGYKTLLGFLFGPLNVLTVQKRYPCSIGSCTIPLANVITDAFFTCPNRKFATQAGSTQNLYMYLFDQVTSSFNFWEFPNKEVPDCKGKVCHGDELPYVFNTAQALKKDFNSTDEALSQTMGGYWASLAKSQRPGSAWPLFNPNSKTYLVLKENSSPANDPLAATANCTLWDDIGYESSATWDRLLAEVKAPQKEPAH